MYKQFQKDYQFPLDNKITILGLRVETGPQPLHDISPDTLKLKDNWKIQIVYKPYDSGRQSVPLLLELPVLWEDELNWVGNLPAALSISYKKKPRSVSAFLQETSSKKYSLYLTLETLIEIDFVESAPANEQDPGTETVTKKEKEPRERTLEDKLIQLSGQIDELVKKVTSLEKKMNFSHAAEGRIGGYVLDSFTMIPIGKCIIEFCPKDSIEASIKIATDGRGFYSVRGIAPGTYDLKIKHPRYAPLAIKDYVINEGDNKYQDFLLRRA
ncbi:MAG: carboxypeptidase-like regulatory domain-containing protein [Peptococcaceae bacterium]|jgi:hypothetical protein|nr:carboxypeptidase-like regulatory domain-containing protein [Peptococcaceae bacterium]MDH7524182.1 carboxypeptidase-like regulatory domain-containing protein [Peptococcaceae bacterium]